MALIKCTECGKEISDKASACPSCGNPRGTQSVAVDNKVSVELTDKSWKTGKLVSVLLSILGIILIFRSPAIGGLILLIAFVTGVVATIGAWWSNG